MYAKWHWNTWDCVTGLHDQQSWECNPVTPVEWVSLSFCTHPCVLAFITHILRINGIEMALVCLIQYTFPYVFFKFAICFIALMNLGETSLLKRRDMVTVWRTMLLLCCYCTIVTALWRHAVWIRIVTSHNAWMGYEYSLPNFNRPRSIHKHNPHILETMRHVW